MRRHTRSAIIAALMGASMALATVAAPTASFAKSFSNEEAGGALKEALDMASGTVVSQLGKSGGFWNDPLVRIGLPGPLKKLGGIMKFTDKAGLTDGLHRKLNEAAENAVPKALPLFKNAIKSMSVKDAIGIVSGGEDSATQYFKTSMGESLQTQMRPVISQSLQGVDAFSFTNKVVEKYKLPIKGLSDSDLTNYVSQKAADGVFYYMAQEEKKIRANPLKAGSSLIKKVFGAL
jgi:Protein of unknown function (DUF4197)